MDTFLAITSKRDLRAYTDEPVDEETLRRILQAGRVTGSARNRQEWRFHVLATREARERAAGAVTRPPNLLGAPLAIALTVHGRQNAFDAGRVAQNMMLAAANDGIASCPNMPADHVALGALLELAADEQTAIILTFGHPARARDAASLSPDEWLARADRKPLAELVRHR